MKNKSSLFYIAMTVIVLYIPVFWSLSGNTLCQNLCSLGFVSGIFLLSLSFSSLLLSFKTRSKIVYFFLKSISIISLCLPGILYFFYLIPFITAGKSLTKDDVLAFFQTYKQEAISYLIANVKLDQLLWTGSILLLFFISAFMAVLKFQNFSEKLKKLMLALGIIFSCAFINNPLTSPITNGITELHEYRVLAEHNKQIKEIVTEKSPSANGIFVVVIGESQNRNRMQVYGYNRPTTPFLVANRNDDSKGRWIYFNNPYSCHTHTLRVLSWALTDINSYNQKKLSRANLLTNILDQNGYKTWWISNQKSDKYYKSLVFPSHQIWLNNEETDPYDEIILDNLPTETDLKNKPTVIFIHLMGSHTLYPQRYPTMWTMFESNSTQDQYDNTILYNDYIISQIYYHFSNMKNFSAMIYMADHSDDIYNIIPHNCNLFTWEMTKIPFFAFFGKDYIKNNPEKIKVLQSNADKPFINEMFFDFMLGILNIKNENYIPQNDLGSSEYIVRDDFATLHGTKKISEERNDEYLKYRSKIWLHKVNSPEKFERLGHKYYGLELDIIYHENEDDFENSHNKTDLSKHRLEKTLEKYRNPMRLWFDFKNLSESNKEKAKAALEKLTNKYGITKSRFLVESPKWKELDTFTQSGWITSYYLQIHDINNLSEDKRERIQAQISEISYSGKVKAISFTHEYYSLVTSANINPQISLLTWFGGKTLEELKHNNEFLSILRNPQIGIVLVEEY